MANDKIRDSPRSLPVLLKILSPRLTGDLRKSELEDQSQEKEAKRSRAGASNFNPRCGLCAPWGSTPRNSWWGEGCRPVLQILILFQTKKSRFQTWPLGRNYVIITCIRAQTKKISSNAFRIRLFLFLSNSFGLGTINTLIRSRNSLENHTRFQTKMGKVYTRFQTKKAPKPRP